MAIRVLIINRQLAFSVALKQSLERTGAFEVHPFTTADAATEYLQTHPQDVVLLDFNSVAPNGAAVVDALRRLQPGIAIVVSPKQNPETVRALALQENIDPPYTTRDIVPLLNRAVEAMRYGEEAQATEEPARPGEIGDRELRPYMVSTDIFQEGQEAPKPEKPQKGSQFRPGEIDPSDLEPRTDVFKEASEAESRNTPPSRMGEYQTNELPSPTTDTLHVEWEGDESASPAAPEPKNIPPALDDSDPRPPSRYVVREFPKVSGEGEEGRKELSEQDLLNLAVNPETNTPDNQAQRPPRSAANRAPERDWQEEDEAPAEEDVEAMWKPLTRDEEAEDPFLSSPMVEEEISFDFDFDEEDEGESGDTPVSLPFEDVGPVADWLEEAIQTDEPEPDLVEKAEDEPRTVTDFLKARTSELEQLELEDSDEPSVEQSWTFPEDDLLAGDAWPEEDEQPPRDPEQIALSRKPTDPLPESIRTKLINDELLAQQFEVESLVDEPPVFADALDEPSEQTFDEDAFEPPVSPEDIIASWEQPAPQEQEPPYISETRVLDPDDGIDGVARLEEIANEIRHTRSTAKLPPAAPEPVNEPEMPEDDIFQKLAAEEPPMPAAMDGDSSGTVGDLYVGVHDPAFQNVLQILRGEEDAAHEVREPEALISDTPSEGPMITQSEIEEIFTSFSRRDRPRDEFDFDDVQSNTDNAYPAHLILETALDESTPADAFSLDELIHSLERQLMQQNPAVRPLPSWQEDQNALGGDLYVREPDFLAGVIADVDALPNLEDQDEFGDATTYAGEAVEPAPDAETELLRPDNYPTSLPEMDWLIEPPVTEEDTNDGTRPIEAVEAPPPAGEQLLRLEDEEPEFNTEFERLAAFNLETEEEREITPAMGLPAIQDPYIAQVALSLTQISLEELAAAVLAQNNEVIAHAGRMGRNDIDEVRRTINDQWDTGSEQANIRFITLPSSGKDYLLYSRRTVNDLTLSLLFPGSTPMRDIRKQGKRLVEALMSVPEPEVYDDEEVEAESMFMTAAGSDVRNVYTYIWLLRDPDLHLNEMVASAIESGLTVQLEERNWQILNLQVRDDCVYLLADVPGEMPPFEVIRDLKRRSAEIARKQNPVFGRQDVWADSYLIVTPGRELDEDEIQEFISFERIS